MCGIAGEILFPKNHVSQNEVKILLKSLSHRGPDGLGTSSGKRLKLLSTRLSIIDIEGGSQPLSNEDKSIEIVGNGEIYNYKELSKRLNALGHRFRTQSDIEIAAHAYEEWGTEFVEKLRGMFALAINDKRNRKVLLVRDRMGEKPIYYTRTSKGIVFASELKAILKIKGVDKSLDFNSLYQYLNLYFIPEPKTAFANIQKLEAGSMLIIDSTSLSTKIYKYWDPTKIKPVEKGISPVEMIRKTLSEACELTLVSDVPVGIALSGGLDSSSILALTASKYKGRMKAFSVGYEERPPSDERKLASELAQKFGVDFVETEISTQDAVDQFPFTVRHSDDPIADIAAFSIFSVYKLANENGIKVLLAGVGGDELFWGYNSTRESVKESYRLLRRTRQEFPNSIVYSNPNPKQTAQVFMPFLTKNFLEKIQEESLSNLFLLQGEPTKTQLAKGSMDLVRDLWLKSNVIPLTDRLSMANSVESRSPFLDFRLVEKVLSSKECVDAYEKEGKYWFKKALSDLLPRQLLKRPKKGFTPPANWVKEINQKYKHLLRGGFLYQEGIFEGKGLARLVSGSSPFPTHSFYQLILLEIWGREFVYGQEPGELR